MTLGQLGLIAAIYVAGMLLGAVVGHYRGGVGLGLAMTAALGPVIGIIALVLETQERGLPTAPRRKGRLSDTDVEGPGIVIGAGLLLGFVGGWIALANEKHLGRFDVRFFDETARSHATVSMWIGMLMAVVGLTLALYGAVRLGKVIHGSDAGDQPLVSEARTDLEALAGE